MRLDYIIIMLFSMGCASNNYCVQYIFLFLPLIKGTIDFLSLLPMTALELWPSDIQQALS